MLQELFKTKLHSVNPTTVLTGMGISGVITTAYLASRASFKASEIIRRQQQFHNDEDQTREDLPFTEKAKLVWVLYTPAVASGATTIVAIVMANQQASKKIAALTVASGVSERALSEYKAKVLEKLGETKEMKIRDEIAQDRVLKTPIPVTTEVIIAGSGDVLCFDTHTGRYFQSSVEKIRQAQNKINFEILNHMGESLSRFYDEVGLPPTPDSEVVGWNSNEQLEVLFSSVLTPDSRPCLAIVFCPAPFVGYEKLY